MRESDASDRTVFVAHGRVESEAVANLIVGHETPIS
jgi:hypothetical protein